MQPITVDIQEFRDNLGTYLLEGAPVAITRGGEAVGYFIPTPRKPSAAEIAALEEAAERLHAELAAMGLTEDEIVEDFKRWRTAQHR